MSRIVRTTHIEKGSLTAHLWSSIEEIYGQILAHPFIMGLTDGSLAESSFRHYVEQDALYLTRYARALSVCSAKAPTGSDVAMFANHAAGAMAVEESLHEEFFVGFGLSAADVSLIPMSPTNLAYTSYLLATVYSGSFVEALGAVLPCYWIYLEVGKALLERGSPNPLYQRWIDTYGGDEYAGIVQEVLDLTERIGHGLGGDDRLAMTAHFITTSRYEWMFWDSALRQESWPI